MDKIIQDFQKFKSGCSENFWVPGDGFEENFQIIVDNHSNKLDDYLHLFYNDLPLWFHFISFDYSLFDYFKERIHLNNDFDYSLLFNVEFIESSHYFKKISPILISQKLTPFCSTNTLIQLLKYQDDSIQKKFNFDENSFIKIQSYLQKNNPYLKNCKLSLASISHILEHDFHTAKNIIYFFMTNDFFKNVFLEQLNQSKEDHFFSIKVHLIFNFQETNHMDFVHKINKIELNNLISDIIYYKKNVNKKTLFSLMNQEHLVLALSNQFFELNELSHFIKDKKIYHHLLDHKYSNSHNKYSKKQKI